MRAGILWAGSVGSFLFDRARSRLLRRRSVGALIEAVEPRLLLATITWINPKGGDWDTAANWSNGKVPTADDDVVIDLKNSTALITHDQANADSAKSITSNSYITLGRGSIDLHGGEITITSNNIFRMEGGAILNATLVTENGGRYAILQPMTFNNVTLDKSTHITVHDGETLNVVNALRFNAGSSITVQSGGAINGQDSPQGGAAITGTGTINLFGSAPTAASINGDGATNALIIGAKITINASDVTRINANGAGGVNSQATINVIGSGQCTLGGTFGTFTNEGTITIQSQSQCTLNGFWANVGTIINNNSNPNLGELNLSGVFGHPGTIKSSNGGKVTVTGTCNLGGKTLDLNSTTGSWTLDGGKIENGTIDSTGGATLTIPPLKLDELQNMELDNVEHGLPFDVPSGADLSIQGYLNLGGGMTFNVSAGGATTAGGRIDFNGDPTVPPSLLGTGVINFVGTGTHRGILDNQDNAQPLTIGPKITIDGGDGIIESVNASLGGIINQGSIKPNIKGEAINLSGGPFTNKGKISISTGASLNGSGLPGGLQNVSGALMGGTGTYIGNVNNGGTIEPGSPNSTGSLSINGDLHLGSSSRIIEDLGGTSAGEFSQLKITGSAALAGKLVIETYDNFKPAAGQAFSNVISYASETGKLTATGLSSGLLALPHIGAKSTSLKIAVPKLVFSIEPPLTAVAGETLPTVQVKIENPNGSVLTTDNSIVTLTVASGPGTLFATASAMAGIASFSNLVLDAAGTYKLKAADSLELIIFSTPIVVIPAP